MKTIKLKLLDRQDLVSINTEATTLGEFKNLSEVKELNINWEATKLIDRATKTSFDIDEAKLPTIDALFFVVPTKTKAGSLPYKEVKKKIKKYKKEGGEVPFNYTQATTQQLNDFWDSINKEKVEEVSETQEEVENADSLLEETKELLKKAVENLSKLVKLPAANQEDVAEAVQQFKDTIALYVTKSDLDLEAEHLAAIFK